MDGLASLRQADFTFCLKLKHLPNVDSCKRLESLILEQSGIVELPNMSLLGRLLHLNIKVTNILELPDSITHLQTVETLDFTNCKNLERMPVDFSRMTMLRSLLMSQHMSNPLQSDAGLKLHMPRALIEFDADGCRFVHDVSLPNTMKIIRLDSTGVPNVHVNGMFQLHELSLPAFNLTTIGPFHPTNTIKVINIPRSDHLISFNAGNLRQCKTLMMSDGPRLERIDCIEDMQQMTHMSITRCSALTHLNAKCSYLQALETFIVAGCNNLTRLPEMFGHMPNLELVVIAFCGLIDTIPASIGQASALRWLTLRFCPCLTTLPSSLRHLSPAITLSTDGTPITEPPAEVVAAGMASIKEYFDNKYPADTPWKAGSDFGNDEVLATLLAGIFRTEYGTSPTFDGADVNRDQFNWDMQQLMESVTLGSLGDATRRFPPYT